MIFVSAGHHQDAKGASFEGANEFDEALFWQLEILHLLGSLAMPVPSSRLGSKIQYINDTLRDLIGPHLAIEIHFNSDPGRQGRGSETLYYPKSHIGKDFANQIQEQLSIIYGPNRGAKEGWYQMNPEKGPDYFLAKTNCPALIIEPEFIHNYEKIREGRSAGCKVIADTLKKLQTTSE